MDILNEIIAYIAHTNLFNFIIFAGIIIFLVCKLNVKSKLEAAVKDVDTSINESEEAKVESEKKLSDIEKSVAHISEEVDLILRQSDDNAKLVGEKIAEDTEKSLVVLKENTQKVIKNNSDILRNDIIRRASLASVEVAKAHIIEELKQNPDLHDRLVDESVNAIEGAEF